MEPQSVIFQEFHTVRRNNGNIDMETQSVIFPEFRTVLINGNIDAIITLNSNVQQSNTLKISTQEGGVPPKITCFIDYNNDNNVLNIVRSVDRSNVTTSGGGTSPKTPIPLVHIEVNNLQKIILTGPAYKNTYTINGNNNNEDNIQQFFIKINGTGKRKIINDIKWQQQADIINVKSYGPGPVALIGEAKMLNVESYDVAYVLLGGHATYLNVSVFGVSHIDAKKLKVATKVDVTYHNDIGKARFNIAAKVHEARGINNKVDVTYHDILAYFNSAAKINQAPDINNNVQYDNNNAQDDIKLGPKMGGR